MLCLSTLPVSHGFFESLQTSDSAIDFGPLDEEEETQDGGYDADDNEDV